jgi:hypothetical protein
LSWVRSKTVPRSPGLWTRRHGITALFYFGSVLEGVTYVLNLWGYPSTHLSPNALNLLCYLCPEPDRGVLSGQNA